MKTIKCPNCGAEFGIDEDGYARIADQVRSMEFDKELKKMLEKHLAEAETAKKLAVMEAVNKKREEYENKLKEKDAEIDRLSKYRLSLSTKALGEDLEQYCLGEFNKVRTSAFPDATFEKDNDASGGSKGDFIFRDHWDGREFISIMFEMKNEDSNTASKHKNEDFFDKLDKDRNQKNCEYAVLVSVLEADNPAYSDGILDVSYRYPKMYVVRPQFFILMIMLLRNAARNSLQYMNELELIREQRVDLSCLEENIKTFRKGFSRNCEEARKQFEDAVKSIDSAIKSLQKTRENLMSSEKNLLSANEKADELSVRKLAGKALPLNAPPEDSAAE